MRRAPPQATFSGDSGDGSYTAGCDAGWSSQVARRAHNPEVAGSNPAPATAKGAGNGAFGFLRRALRPETFAPTFATETMRGRPNTLRIRTNRGMVELSGEEAAELRERLRAVPAGQPAEQTIAVSANASTSITFTQAEKAAVAEVLARWSPKPGRVESHSGLLELRAALLEELARDE